LRHLLAVVREHAEAQGADFPDGCIERIEHVVRQTWPTERVYIPPVGSRKDPDRRAKIREMAKRLPTGVTAERLGVSKSWVYRAIKNK
jgi:hypothetical protein